MSVSVDYKESYEQKILSKGSLSHLREVIKSKGVFHVLNWAANEMSAATLVYYYKMFNPKTFHFNGKKYDYFYHSYNRTWTNERAVEIPIIQSFLQKHKNENILEVGDVLSHYFPFEHDIVDKYELGFKNVINADITDFKSKKRYDLIVSISTIEHIGWDEKPREKDKTLRAIENMKSHLAKKGTLVVTAVLGYNRYMQNLLLSGRLKFDETYYFKRVPGNNDWRQVKAAYNNSAMYTNKKKLLLIGIVKKIPRNAKAIPANQKKP